ncbi:MAG: hypothetical protein AB1765_05385 [Candidatus Hydrogenedentota bacterium]
MKKILLLFLLSGFFIGERIYAEQKELDIASLYKESYKYEATTNYIDAFRVLVPVHEKYSQTYTINLRFGWLTYLMKKYKDAEEYYKQAELAAPYSLEAKNGIALVYLAKEEWLKAEEKCNQTLKIDYYNYYANLYLITSYKNQKKYEEAEAIARKMLYVYPTNVTFLTELGIVLFYQGKEEEAYSIFDNVLILDPENITAKQFYNNKQ